MANIDQAILQHILQHNAGINLIDFCERVVTILRSSDFIKKRYSSAFFAEPSGIVFFKEVGSRRVLISLEMSVLGDKVQVTDFTVSDSEDYSTNVDTQLSVLFENPASQYTDPMAFVTALDNALSQAEDVSSQVSDR